MRSSKFYRSLLLTYIGIVCLYTLIMIGLFFVGAKKYIGNRLDTQNELVLEQYTKRVDSQLDIAFSVSRQMFSSTEVRTFLLSKPVDYYNLAKIHQNIHQTLSPFSRMNFFLTIGKSNSNIVVSPLGTARKHEFYKQMGFPFANDDERDRYFEENNLKLFPVLKGNTSFYPISEELITFMEKHRLLSNIEMYSFISFPEKQIFPNIVDGAGEQAGFLVKNGEEVFIARNYGIDETQWEKVLGGEEIRGYSIYQYPLNKGALAISYLAKKPSFMEMWTEIMSEFGWVYLGLIFFGAIGAFFTTRKVYKPVLSVVSEFKEDFDLKNMTDEFDVLRTASVKMTRTKEELEQIIKESKEPLKAKFVRDLLYGLSDEDDIEEKLTKYDLLEWRGPFRLILVEHSNYAKMGDQFSEESFGEIRRHIMSFYTGLLMETAKRFEIVELEKKRLAIILSDEEYCSVKSKLEDLLAHLLADYGIQVLAIIGPKAEELENLDYSYSEAIGQLVYRNLLPKNKIVSHSHKLEVKHTAYYYPLDVEESLINYVEQRKEEEAHLLLEHILNQNFKHHSITADTIPLLTFAIIATIHRLLNQSLKAVEDVYGEGTILYLELRAIVEENEFKEKVHSLFQTLLEHLEDGSHEEQEDTLASRLLDYIHANYRMDVSLNDVADAFSITPTYVSMLFKKEYKTNFKDYLNRYKIEQAKELMKNNRNIKNKELSEAVGFNSVNTFLRLFKKYTGETPGKYMESKR